MRRPIAVTAFQGGRDISALQENKGHGLLRAWLDRGGGVAPEAERQRSEAGKWRSRLRVKFKKTDTDITVGSSRDEPIG